MPGAHTLDQMRIPNPSMTHAVLSMRLLWPLKHATATSCDVMPLPHYARLPPCRTPSPSCSLSVGRRARRRIQLRRRHGWQWLKVGMPATRPTLRLRTHVIVGHTKNITSRSKGYKADFVGDESQTGMQVVVSAMASAMMSRRAGKTNGAGQLTSRWSCQQALYNCNATTTALQLQH